MLAVSKVGLEVSLQPAAGRFTDWAIHFYYKLCRLIKNKYL